MRRLCCVILLFMGSSALADDSFLVAPTHVTLDLAHPVTQTFIVTNTGDDRIHLKVKPLFLHIGDSGFKLGHSLGRHKENAGNLARYMLVSPRALSLMPGEKRVVRLSVVPPAHLKEGHYRGHLLFHMLNIAHTIDENGGDKTKGRLSMHINLLMESAIAVTGVKGTPVYKPSFSCARGKGGALAVTVHNPSVWRIKGALDVMQLSTHKKAQVDDLLVLRESTRAFDMPALRAIPSRYQLTWSAGHHHGIAHCRVA